MDLRNVAVVEMATNRSSFCGAMISRRMVAQGCSWPKYTESMDSCAHAVDDRGGGGRNCQKGVQCDAMFWRTSKLR